jgi:hypothetical protein
VDVNSEVVGSYRHPVSDKPQFFREKTFGATQLAALFFREKCFGAKQLAARLISASDMI